MGPKYNDATSSEDMGSTKTCSRSKRALKRVKVPNLAQAVDLEKFGAIKGGNGHPLKMNTQFR